MLAEFDEAKRSCRKRLTEHNRRRRKPAGAQGKDSPPHSKKADASITSSYTGDHRSKTTPLIYTCLDLNTGYMHRVLLTFCKLDQFKKLAQ